MFLNPIMLNGSIHRGTLQSRAAKQHTKPTKLSGLFQHRKFEGAFTNTMLRTQNTNGLQYYLVTRTILASNVYLYSSPIDRRRKT